MIASNPAVNASPPRVIKPDIKPPDPADVVRLIAAAEAEDPELGLFVRLAAVTGCRRGELCALQWRDFLGGGQLIVRRAVVKGTDELVVKEAKTGRDRRMALDAATIKAVEAQRVRSLERAKECGLEELAPEAFVFSRNVEGTLPWRPDSGATERFMKLRDSLDLPKVRLHDLRHFVATRLLDAGVPVRSVSERLGHASATTTLTIYAAALPARDKVSADIMGALVDSTK
jgi:integrase